MPCWASLSPRCPLWAPLAKPRPTWHPGQAAVWGWTVTHLVFWALLYSVYAQRYPCPFQQGDE